MAMVVSELTVDKTKVVKVESLNRMFDIMSEDQTFMGRVPACTKEDFQNAIIKRLGDAKELNWTTFRYLLDDISWRTVHKEEVKDKVEKLFEEANLLLKAGKKQDSFDMSLKAAGIARHFSYHDLK